ncbi:MAG: succinoglycan biosynthesis protein exoa [Bacteroidetes bacterium]|nr:MAG: succinoglycan biosynthesis protein exoa [Bacteroidota bacterium]
MEKLVSIIVPCRNEENYIGALIESFLNQDYPSEKIELLIMDGMSDDNTRNVIKQYSNDHPLIQLIDNPKKYAPFALNKGIQSSKGEIIIIFGAHAEADKDFIKENVKAMEQSNDIGCTGGIIENIYTNKTAEIIGLAMSSPFGVGNAHFRTGNKIGYVDTVAFGAYKQIVFEKAGYFDEDLIRNQDDEFNFRIIKNGFKIYLSQNIRSKYHVRGSFTNLFQQYYQYGYWKVYVSKKHKTVTTTRQLIPLLFVLFLIIGVILSMLNQHIRWLFLLILGIYTTLALIFASKQTSRYDKIFKVTFSFFLLHLSYGLGYFVGIIHFLMFNKKPSKKSQGLTR